MTDKTYTNRLINEKSPYLLQHAHNPVDWFPWGEVAFEKAKNENKLIFLSIGYSTCHWCHVMEKESFENEEVAHAMNDLFVSIKVDREERPDIDGAFMAVSQMMTGSGGWPLNIILTPEKVPVFALTYIPRESRRGMVGIIELTKQLKELWSEGREEVERRAQEVLSNLQGFGQKKKGNAISAMTVEKIANQLKSSFDRENGGFGTAPKFPSPQNLMFLLRIYQRTGNAELLTIVEKTLSSMRAGGIYDHVGFGFHRYSTDAGWFLPHFEKMIYDQAFLMMAYTEAFLATGKQEYRKVVDEIAQFVEREMTAKEGGFFSAIDADSENEEGKFYTWRGSELVQLLGAEEAGVFMSVYNMEMAGNYLDEATGRSVGKNILYMSSSIEQEAGKLSMKAEELNEFLEQARLRLFVSREKRVKPHLDDKILTDMNGLMIAALSKAYRAFDEKRYLNMSKKAASFILEKLLVGERLLHRYRDGESAIDGYLDDYSFLIFGLLELFLSTMESGYLENAKVLANTVASNFRDKQDGGFFGTAEDSEKLPVRLKEGHDGAIPSGNSVHMLNLLRLGIIFSDDKYRNDALEIADAFFSDIERAPMYHAFMGIGIDYATTNNYLVKIWDVLNGHEKARDLMWRSFYPKAETVLLNVGNVDLLKLLDEPIIGVPEEERAKIFVCTEHDCLPPVTGTEELLRILEK